MTVQGVSTVANNLIAIGSESMQAVSKGCNRLTVHLAGLPANPIADMGDSAGRAYRPWPGSSRRSRGCIGGTPDEDQDGRANSCDLCPDDSDPTPADTDGDGLPGRLLIPIRAPRRTRLLYFDFRSIAPAVTGSTPNTFIATSFMTLDYAGQNVLTSNNGVDTLPTDVRVQAHIFLEGHLHRQPRFSDAGVFRRQQREPGQRPRPKASCARCTYHGGGPQTRSTSIRCIWERSAHRRRRTLPVSFSAMYRMRVTQRSTGWTCEATANGLNPATVDAHQGRSGPLFRCRFAPRTWKRTFTQFVAESALP